MTTSSSTWRPLRRSSSKALGAADMGCDCAAHTHTHLWGGIRMDDPIKTLDEVLLDFVATASAVEVEEAAELSLWHRLVCLRCLRPDQVCGVAQRRWSWCWLTHEGGSLQVVPGVQRFITNCMGPEYIDSPVFDPEVSVCVHVLHTHCLTPMLLQASLEDSDCATPIVWILSPGADPMSELLAIAEKHGCGRSMTSISLGQGQVWRLCVGRCARVPSNTSLALFTHGNIDVPSGSHRRAPDCSSGR